MIDRRLNYIYVTWTYQEFQEEYEFEQDLIFNEGIYYFLFDFLKFKNSFQFYLNFYKFLFDQCFLPFETIFTYLSTFVYVSYLKFNFFNPYRFLIYFKNLSQMDFYCSFFFISSKFIPFSFKIWYEPEFWIDYNWTSLNYEFNEDISEFKLYNNNFYRLLSTANRFQSNFLIFMLFYYKNTQVKYFNKLINKLASPANYPVNTFVFKFWLKPVFFINISLFQTFKKLHEKLEKKLEKKLWDKERKFNFGQFFKFWFKYRFNAIDSRLRFLSILTFIRYYFIKLLYKNVNFNYHKINRRSVARYFTIPRRSKIVILESSKIPSRIYQKKQKKLFYRNFRRKRSYRKKIRIINYTYNFFKTKFTSNFVLFFKPFIKFNTFRSFRYNFKQLRDKKFLLTTLPLHYNYTPFKVNKFKKLYNYYSGLHFIYRKHRLVLFYNILWNFRILVSKLLNVETIREVIIKFHKKRVWSFINYKFRWKNNKKKFIYFFKNYLFSSSLIKKKKRTNKALWVSKVTPKSLFIPRLQFFYNLHKKFKYQYRLTKYITRFYKLKVLELARISEFRIINILLRSQFFFNENITYEFIKKKFIYINGILCINSFTVLSPYDIIQVSPSANFYLYYKWNIIFLDSRLNRFFYFMRYWVRRSYRTYPKESSRRIPHWVIYKKFSFYEIPNYFEVDFLTLTIVLLNTYYWSINYYHYYTFRETPFATIRSHNWKYLT